MDKSEMRPNPALLSIVVMLLALFAVFGIARRGVPKVVATNIENLPMVIDSYTATEDSFSQAVYDELNADQHVYRHYRNLSGKQIDLYIGYYGTAKGGRTGHNPYACFPSSGWGIVETGTVRLAGISYRDKVDVNYMLTTKDNVYLVILHWYQSDGVNVLDSGFKQNIQRFVGRVFENKNDGAFVRISADGREMDVPAMKDRVMAFSQNVLELLPNYWPDEK